MSSENKSSQVQKKDKRIKNIKKETRGYTISVEEENGNKYNIFVNDTEMTDLEYTEQLIKNRINMFLKHEENISKLMETLI